MKPIARVHWIDNGVEKNQDVYTQGELKAIGGMLKSKNVVTWTCLLSGDAVIPKNHTSRSAGTA